LIISLLVHDFELYMKVVILDEIYNFVVQTFFTYQLFRFKSFNTLKYCLKLNFKIIEEL